MSIFALNKHAKSMRTISNREFVANPEMYLGIASRQQDVRIRKGRKIFHLTCEPPAPQQPILEPDDDLRRAITFYELLVGVKEDLREIFASGKRNGK